MVSQSPQLSENQRQAHSRPRRSSVMSGGQLWRRACVLVLLVTIPDIARSGPSRPHVLADRQIQLVANSEKGASLFQNRCSMCHSTQEGVPSKLGPNLHGLFGRRAGTLPEFDYSPDLRNSRIVWNVQTLDEYLADPHRGRPGDKMPYPGLSSKTDRDNLISYLEQATR
jgi:cytochrome c